jgi:hypothetical protein
MQGRRSNIDKVIVKSKNSINSDVVLQGSKFGSVQ